MRRFALAFLSFLALIVVQSAPNQAALIGRGVVLPPVGAGYFASPIASGSGNGLSSGSPFTLAQVNGFSFPTNALLNLDGGNGPFTGCLALTAANVAPGMVIKPYNGSTFEVDANCAGAQSSAVLVDGVSSFTMQDCVIRGPGGGGVYFGVRLTNSGHSAASGMTVQRCDIGGFFITSATDLAAEIDVDTQTTDGTLSNVNVLHNTLHGLSGVGSTDGNGLFSKANATLSNLTVSFNTVFNIGTRSTACVGCEGIGLEFGQVQTATVNGNVVHDIGANNVNCGGPSGIETYESDSVVIKQNEVYNVRPTSYTTGCDWVGIDLDLGVTNSVVEYNYSHNNFGNGYLLLAGPGQHIANWGNNIVRYNISENDQYSKNDGTEGSITLDVKPGAILLPAYVYNNTVWNATPNTTSLGIVSRPTCLQVNNFNDTTSPAAGTAFFNNICAMYPDASGNDNFVGGLPGYNPTTVSFSANDYFAPSGGTFQVYRWNGTSYASLAAWQAAAPGREIGTLTSNPLLVSGGAGGTCGGTASPICPANYVIGATSPMIGAGFRPDLPPYSQTLAQDYFGNVQPPGVHLAAAIGAMYRVPTTDSTVPTTAVTVPTTGATVAGSVTLTATCADNVRCQSVQFKVDGSAVNSAVLNTGGTFSTAWNSTAVANGGHTITALAYDNSGNTTTSAGISITTLQNTQFYLDSSAGNDTWDGLSATHTSGTHGPWATWANVNSGDFVSGTTISANGTFTGCIVFNYANFPGTGYTIGRTGGTSWTLNANCTGTKTAGILIDGVNGFTLQDFIERGPGDVWYGVRITNSPTGGSAISSSGITVQRGDIGGFYETTDVNDAGYEILVNSGFGSAGTLDTINVLNMTLHGLTGTTSPDVVGIGGFASSHLITNVNYSNNTIFNLGGSTTNGGGLAIGIVVGGVDGGLVSQNLMHDIGANTTRCGGPGGLNTFIANNIIIKFNEVYNVQPTSFTAGCDWVGLDLDGGTTNSIIEYNYTHGNFGSGLLAYVADEGSGAYHWNNNTYRYNISENDNTGGTDITQSSITIGGPGSAFASTVMIYNNTVYQSNPGPAGHRVGCLSFQLDMTTAGSLFANNICEVSADLFNITTFLTFQNHDDSGVTFGKNTYFPITGGSTIQTAYQYNGASYASLAAWQAVATGGDTGTLTSDPTLVSGGAGGTCGGLASPPTCPANYKLQAGSPALHVGIDLTQAPYSLSVGPTNYFGTAIPGGGGTGYDIGAY